MKATQRDFAAFAAKGKARVWFFCGSDDAGIEAAAQRIVGLLPDAGERVELAGADLKRDPLRLDDEARSNSLFGGSRHIWLRATGDEAHDALAILIAAEAECCPVLVLASGATDKSRSAKLLAARDDAVVVLFYPPDLRSVTTVVREMADAAGLRLGGDLAEHIARTCGLDSRIAQSEITKLALYLDASPQSPRSVDKAALAAIGAGTEEDGFAPLVNAVLGGDRTRLADELRRMRELELNPVGLLLAFERRAAQLAGLAGKLGPRGDVAALIESEKAARRIFWKDAVELAGQLHKWRGNKLERLVSRLMELHRALLGNSQNAELLLAQGLAEITRAAARG